MICKWCGETVKSGDKTCRRCRREVGPLSDCGGFYDLVPQARNMAAAPEMPAYDMPVPQAAPAPVKPVMPEKKNNTVNIVAIVAAVLALVMLVCTVSLSGKLKAANAQIDSLKKELSEAEEQPQEGPTGPSIPDKDRPDVGGEGDDVTEDPLQDVTENKQLQDGKLEMMLSEEANQALAAGKQVQIVCTDEDGELVCVLTLTSITDETGVHVIAEVDAQWEDVYFQWYDPENEERPMTWSMGGGEDMFSPENEIGDAEDADDNAEDGEAEQQADSADAPCHCEVTVKPDEEAFNLRCLITAKNGRRDIRIVIDNIHIG